MVRVEKMSEEDIPSLLDLENEAFPLDSWSEKAIREEFNANSEGFQVIKDNGRIAAYIHSQVGYERLDITGAEDDGIIGSIAVLQEYRCQGLGKVLMFAAIESLKNQGATSVKLSTRVSNADMISLAAKFGFKQTVIQPSYYADGEDARVMELQEF